MTDKMEFTGERFIPGVHGNIELEHLHRYYLACEIASGKDILDIACGEGYGSALLAEKAGHVVGVDISSQVISHAQGRYKKGNLEFKVGSCTDIPLHSGSVDLVVCFETIEHIDQQDQMMKEVKRVLKPKGILFISSPDKNNYSLEPGYTNPFHVKELLDYEFEQLLGSHFKNHKLFGQRILFGSHALVENSAAYTRSYNRQGDEIKINNGIYKPTYWLAISSDGDLPELPSSVFEQAMDDSEFVQQWKIVAAERSREINNLNAFIKEQKEKIDDLESEVIRYATSKSWRWTRVLRQLLTVIQKVRGRS